MKLNGMRSMCGINLKSPWIFVPEGGILQGRNPVGVEGHGARLPMVVATLQPWAGGHNPVGVVINWRRLPRVARASQPWAGGRSPVGAGKKACAVMGWFKPRVGVALFPIPKGLRPPAQGCPVGGTTLGTMVRYIPQPQRGCGPDGGWRKERRSPVGAGVRRSK